MFSFRGNRKIIALLTRPVRLVLAPLVGVLIFGIVIFLLAARSPDVLAAPPVRPLAEIITATDWITHTANTTHEMRVFADGTLSNQFITDDGSGGRNQIDQMQDDPEATTLAVLFDQHPVNTVDVGVQGEFTATVPITLNTTSSLPGYVEDTSVTYASGALDYQVTQRTLATYDNNCVVMELDVRNTGGITLTGGKLFFMVNIDVAHTEAGDIGFYESDQRLLYLTDYNNGSDLPGFAMGVSLLQGEWYGYGINGFTGRYSGRSYPVSDDEIRTEMLSPMNAIVDGSDGVLWIVANIPDLATGAAAPLAFGICAKNGGDEDEAADNMIESFHKVTNLSAVKNAAPLPGSIVQANQPITYNIAISNTGNRRVYDVVLTDTIPAFTELINYSVTEGDITVSDGVVTANIGDLAPTGETVTVTLVVRPWITVTDGTIISNQALIVSEPIITATNVVTHLVRNRPVLSVVKYATPSSVVNAGDVLTYTVVVSNVGLGVASGVVISDPLPADTQFVSGSVTLDPPGAGVRGSEPPLLASDVVISPGDSVTAAYAVTVNRPLTNGTVITNTAVVSSPLAAVPATDTVTHTVIAIPQVKVVKDGPSVARVGDTIVFTFTVTNAGDSLLQVLSVQDDLAGAATLVGGDSNGDGWLDLVESWTYTASYTIPQIVSPLLVNTVTVTAQDAVGAQSVATDTHSTSVLFAPVLTMTKAGPSLANVGESTVFTLTIRHDGGSDGSPIQNIGVNDDYAGAATRVGGDNNGNGVLEVNEVWTYTVSYTIQPTDPNPLVNTGLALGLDKNNNVITATARHSTTLRGFVPVLYVDKDGPASARVGETVVYTFNVINLTPPAIAKFNLNMLGIAAVGDGSAITVMDVIDDRAGAATYLDGDENQNGILDGGELWIYTAGYTIPADGPDPLINQVAVTGMDPEGDLVAGNDLHSTDISHTSSLNIVKTEPMSATAGELALFTFAASHAWNSDGSPITMISVVDTVVGTTSYVSGDTNTNALLDSDETWLYQASYLIPLWSANPLFSWVNAQGRDVNGEPVSATRVHSTTVQALPNTPGFLYLPLIKKN